MPRRQLKRERWPSTMSDFALIRSLYDTYSSKIAMNYSMFVQILETCEGRQSW